MIDPATPDALRAIASMMRMEGYRTDATGVEALVLDNAADEIERLRAAVALSVYELHFVADEHDCEQCREAAKKIMKTAKGGHDV